MKLVNNLCRFRFLELTFKKNISVADVPEETKTKKFSKLIDDFKQQKLTAWQPIPTTGIVLSIFFIVGFVLITVGIGLWFLSDGVREMTILYTNCTSEDSDNGTTCDKVIQNPNTPTCNCTVPFTLPTNFAGKVYMYYALTNFYQNHRRYVRSKDSNQLIGDIMLDGQPFRPSNACFPFNATENKEFIYPCGAIANSLFSDKIDLYWHEPDSGVTDVELIRTGIAWDSDKKYKFKNPPDYGKDSEIWKHFVRPAAWRRSLWEFDEDDPANNGVENEDFIVWMRTAAFPTFRKLYRVLNSSTKEFRDGLPMGNYSLKIQYSYEVASFNGTKSIIISTTSLLGGKNLLLGILYIVVGAICVVLGVVFLFLKLNFVKSTFEMTTDSTQ